MTTWLTDIKGVLLDVDGVLYRGNEVIPGAREFLAFLDQHHIPYVYVTNNSTLSPEQYAARLRQKGFPARAEQVVGSAEATARLLVQEHSARPTVLVIGEQGLKEVLSRAGFPLTDNGDEAQVVVVGLDRYLTYDKLAEATYAIRRGATFYGTNPDRTFPTERGLAPGGGAILVALEAATDRTAIMVGKPEPPIFRLGLERLGLPADQVLMVGDRVETDIEGAKRVGLRAALVLTGVTREPPPPGPHAPDLVARDLTELQALLAAAGASQRSYKA